MVVAVVAVGVVKAPFDQEVDVVAVGHRLVTAALPVLVSFAPVGLVATVRALLVHGEAVVVHVISMGVVQVPVMEEVDMALVDHGSVAATRPVKVLVGFVPAALSLHGSNVRASAGVVAAWRDPAGARPAVAKGFRTMALRQLRSALHAFTREAAWQLASNAGEGDDLPFEIVESGRSDSPLYCYRPLTSDFIESHGSALSQLPTYLPASHALAATGGIAEYLEVQGVAAEAGRDATEAALHCFLARVFAESIDFVFDERRFDRAWLELEQTLDEEHAEQTTVAVLYGLETVSAEVPLGDGLALARGDEYPEAPDAARWSRLDGSSQTLVVASFDPVPGDAGAIHRTRTALRRLLTGLRLYDDGRFSYGSLAWTRLGVAPWQPLALGGAQDHAQASLIVEPAQEDELRAFLSLVNRRAPESGAMAWALRRFDLASERLMPSDELTDLLLALRALLEPEGPASGRMAGRLAALCAEPDERADMTARIAHAAALEHAVIDGDLGDDRLDARVAELSSHLRSLLRDRCCGHLEDDLVGLADAILCQDADDARRLSDEPQGRFPDEQTDSFEAFGSSF